MSTESVNNAVLKSPSAVPILPNEAERLAALKSYHILDTATEDDFDELTALASAICQTPVALITFIDEDRQWFKSHYGTEVTETPKAYSFCAHAIASPEKIMVVEDTAKDVRFAENPLVTGEPHVAFYAGVPLVDKQGFGLGSICVVDTKVRELNQNQINALQIIGKQVVDRLELRRKILQLETSNKKLYESENRFRGLISQAPVAIAIYAGDNFVIQEANGQMLNLLGRGPEIIGLPLLEARPELKNHPYMEVINGVYTLGTEHTGESILAPVLKNGEVKEGYFDVTYKPIRDENGTVVSVMVVAADVTEEVQAHKREAELHDELMAINEELVSANDELIESKEELATMNEELVSANLELMQSREDLMVSNHQAIESEARYRNLITQAPVAIAALKGRELIVDQANSMILKIWGKDSSVMGQPLHVALPELQGQPFLKILDDVFTSGQPYYGYEANVKLDRDGKLVDLYVNFVYNPIKNSAGLTTDIVVAANDVTDQVNARISVEETNQRLEIALDAGALGSYDLDLATGIMLCTDQCKKNYGLGSYDAFNLPDLFEAIVPEQREYVQQLIDESIAKNAIYRAEYQIKWPDGSLHWISAQGKPRYEDGIATHMVGVTVDITEKRLQDERKDDFLSIASHELKTPTTSLKAALQLLNLIKDKPTSPMHIRLIEQSNRSMDKMTTLIDDLLNVHRMKGGQLMLNQSTFTLSELLNSCCGHVRLAGKHELIFEGDEALQVYADEHRIEQVVVNFVNNAIKYAPNNKEIYLGVEKLDGFAKIYVRDEGPGIQTDQLPFLFDRYYRADHSGSTYTGLGLGLFICSEIVKRHGGAIGVDSEVSKGSTFWFTLPV